ncbi:energy transducer TonB [Jeongeupia sp. USM3]|uniref:energy transducer TonB n=1 Tax=Jeongeupia sp. USM3 TaxID=1906741 RepID=UPI00089E06C5|nr:energy transducer TonB [Jeongeupia sp. USM3]AOY00522.1 hypothetical protein BJP62_08760 [Jeongeupia sp. USM3]
MQLRYAVLLSLAGHGGVVAFGAGWLAPSQRFEPAMPMTVVLQVGPAVATTAQPAPPPTAKHGAPVAAAKAKSPAPQRTPVLAVKPSALPRAAVVVPTETPVAAEVVAPSSPAQATETAAAGGAGAVNPAGGDRAGDAEIAPSWPGYLANPKPEMPLASRQRGEAGRVVLRVRVAKDGRPQAVTVQQSSGFARLDEAARKTVAERWRFVAARRGETPIDADVNVPIVFRLE